MNKVNSQTAPPVVESADVLPSIPSPQADVLPPATAPVVPWGTLMVIAVLLLSVLCLWMLVLGIQQGRA